MAEEVRSLQELHSQSAGSREIRGPLFRLQSPRPTRGLESRPGRSGSLPSSTPSRIRQGRRPSICLPISLWTLNHAHPPRPHGSSLFSGSLPKPPAPTSLKTTIMEPNYFPDENIFRRGTDASDFQRSRGLFIETIPRENGSSLAWMTRPFFLLQQVGVGKCLFDRGSF